MATQTDTKLTLGYAGMLQAYTPQPRPSGWKKWLREWFWEYRVNREATRTRSGYFFLKGLQKFKEKYPELIHHLDVHFWGVIEQGNKDQATAWGLDDIVRWGGYMTKADSMAEIGRCSVLFLPLETDADPIYIPSKIFDYLRYGKPILILGDPSDCTAILERAGVGIRRDPFDPDGIADALADLIRNQDSLAATYQVDWAYVEENFHVRNLTKQLDALIQEVLADK